MKRNMVHMFRRASALLLTLSLAVGTVGASIGSYVTQDGLELSDTAHLLQGRAYNDGVPGKYQSEQLVEYRPESGLRPIVAYGNTLYGRSDVAYVESWLKGQGFTATAGINGSFFTMANGVPIGCVITNGIVRSSDNRNSVGFRADGTAVIGTPGLELRVTFPNGTTAPVHYNKTLSAPNGLVLYSRDFDAETRSTLPSYNLVLAPDTTSITPGNTVSATVTDIVEDGKSCAIPAGGMVLSLTDESPYESANTAIRAAKPGDKLSISCSISPAWSDVAYACGGDEMLVMDGKAQTEFNLDSAKSRAARTAVGLKADGTLVLYAIDGRQSGYSAGLTLPELAERLAELGCVTALNLDGGGSTTFSARRPGESALSTLNRPSDGDPRKCANFIFLARETVPAGEAAQLHIYPYNAAMLTGARLTLTLRATDAAWQPVPAPDGLTYTAEGGTVSADGVLTAGAAGTATVTVQAPNGSQGVRGVRVTDSPSAITLATAEGALTSLSCAPGQTVDLNASATYFGYRLIAQDDCFTWTASEGIGDIDANGVFTAAASSAAASGTITCTAGTAKVELPVKVGAVAPEGSAIHGFEAGEVQAEGGPGLTLSQVQDAAHVRYGMSSLKVQYDLSQGGETAGHRQLQAALPLTLPPNTDTVGLWVYGDNSNNSLSLQLEGGEPNFKWLGQLNFSGWKYLTAALPAGTTAVTGFSITEYEDASAASGTIWLDQLIAARGPLSDTTPPNLSVEAAGGVLHISVSNEPNGVGWATLSVDGDQQELDLSSGQCSLPLPDDGLAHQVRVEAADRCGNLSARTLEIPGTLNNPFSDTESHWSRDYVSYCARQGIMKGSSDGQWGQVYRPDAAMSRQEFAVALIRFLGVDPDAYADVTLPWADADRVEPWALNAMKAAYSLGYLTGSKSGGALYGQPSASVSRQEAVTILGRTQARGYQAASLEGFSDRGQIGSWAETHVSSMVSQGILAGSHGRLDPTGSLTRGQVAKILYFLY